MTRECPLCKTIMKLTKRWDKKPTSWGARVYWYESDHRCPKLEGSAAIIKKLQKGLGL